MSRSLKWKLSRYRVDNRRDKRDLAIHIALQPSEENVGELQLQRIMSSGEIERGLPGLT